jgi:hypothetical protein
MSNGLHQSFSVFSSMGIAVLTISLAACGGGGGGGGSNDVGPATPSTGTFIDSPVSNIGYRTESIPNGVTDENGHFDYLLGETVTFFIGDLEFPSCTAQGTVSPLELVGTTDINNQSVVNIARLLQSIDEDGDPSNGIRIPDAAADVADQLVIDFSQGKIAFEEDVMNFVFNSGSDSPELVDEETAKQHLADSLLRNALSGSTVIGVDDYFVVFVFKADGTLVELYNDDSTPGLHPIDPTLGYLPQKRTGSWSLEGDRLTLVRPNDIETVSIAVDGDQIAFDMSNPPDGVPEFIDQIAVKVTDELLIGSVYTEAMAEEGIDIPFASFADSLCGTCSITFHDWWIGADTVVKRDGTPVYDFSFWKLTDSGSPSVRQESGNINVSHWEITGTNGELNTYASEGYTEYYFLTFGDNSATYVSYEVVGAEQVPTMRQGTLTRTN